MAEVSELGTPEFHLVVRRPRRAGPLAPYRFALTVAFALAIAGSRLWQAAETGAELDGALVRAAGAALFMWILVGRINAILATPARRSTRIATDP